MCWSTCRIQPAIRGVKFLQQNLGSRVGALRADICICTLITHGLNKHRVHRNISFRVYSSRISHLNVVQYRFILTIFISMSTFSGYASSASDRFPHPTSGNTLLCLSRNTAELHVPLTFNRREIVRQTDCPGRSLREKSRHIRQVHRRIAEIGIFLCITGRRY